MPVTVQISEKNNEVIIRITGMFDFNLHRDFRQAYESAQKHLAKPLFVIDLSGADYVDSSALGMLLLLRKHAGGDQDAVRIINAQPEVRKILEIANFNCLFKVD